MNELDEKTYSYLRLNEFSECSDEMQLVVYQKPAGRSVFSKFLKFPIQPDANDPYTRGFTEAAVIDRA